MSAKEERRTTGVGSAIAEALRIVSDPTNRAVHCACGTVYLSAAAPKDVLGRPCCLGCGEPAESP
jgi:hypothetical protein